MVTCSHCQASNADTAERCSGCSKPLAKRRAADAPGGAYAGGSVPAPESEFDHNILVTAAAGKLIGLDVSSGQVLWWSQLAQPHATLYGVLMHGRKVFTLSSEGRLFVIDYLTGRMLWTAPAGVGEGARVVIEATFIFLAHGEQIDCYNMHGWRLWTQRLPGLAKNATLVLPRQKQA